MAGLLTGALGVIAPKHVDLERKLEKEIVPQANCYHFYNYRVLIIFSINFNENGISLEAFIFHFTETNSIFSRATLALFEEKCK